MNKFTPMLKVGECISNEDLTKIFKVGNMGGMRRSKQTGTLVIISDHTKGLYQDKWIGDVLHYTGMGKNNDQTLSGNQNKTLAESEKNGVEVHLFEVLRPSKYIYLGKVHLCGAPYQEVQKDDSGKIRKVWMFPIQTENKITVKKNDLEDSEKKALKKAESLTEEELKSKATEHSTSSPSYRSVESKTYIRDPFVSEYAKNRAKGICQLCGKPAPFNDKNGKPYLECHHIVWLSEGGADSIENTVALCPNCHRKMHILNLSTDKKVLLKKATC